MRRGSLANVRATAREEGSNLPEVMNIRQASHYLGVAPDTLYKYLSESKIPAFKLGNRWRLKKTTLDRWMEHQSQSGRKKEGEGVAYRRHG